jgi:lipoprotein NlpI
MSLLHPVSSSNLLLCCVEQVMQGNVEASIEDFDAVLALAPRMKPFMWQRGLALYYAGRFQEAAEQFRDDVAVNPNDTEEVKMSQID